MALTRPTFGISRFSRVGLHVDDPATAYAGSFPTTVAALNGWSQASIWNVAYNFTSATVGPTACNSMTGSTALNLTKLGSSNNSALATAPQGGYATQGGLTISSDQDFIYAGVSTSWSQSTTVPTCYLVTLRFDAAPTSYHAFLGGQTGSAGGGWFLACHQTAGIVAAIGDGTTGFVLTSYIGGTNFYDGEYHTIMLVIDDAAGKAKIYSEFANTESTGLTIGGGASFCTVGPSGAGGGFYSTITYLLVARGEHQLLYDNAQTLFDEYEDARLNNVNKTAIAGLPTTLAEMDSLTGLSFDTLYNMGGTTVTPAAGSSGGSLAADTGIIHSATNGTAPTATAAATALVRRSFTSQGATTFDSTWDNLTGTAMLPTGATPMFCFLVYKIASSANLKQLISRASAGPNRGWYIDSNGSDVLRMVSINSGATATALSTAGTVGGDGLWHVVLVSSPGNNGGAGGTLSALVSGAAEVTTAHTPLATAVTVEGAVGAHAGNASDATPNCYGSPSIALIAWGEGTQPDATARGNAMNAFRWKYGL